MRLVKFPDGSNISVSREIHKSSRPGAWPWRPASIGGDGAFKTEDSLKFNHLQVFFAPISRVYCPIFKAVTSAPAQFRANPRSE
jgi:hypothetical protein